MKKDNLQNNMKKKVIISGVGGQDGSYMVDYLLQNTDHEVYGMVRRSSNPNFENIQQNLNNSRFHLIYGDLSDSSSIDKVISSIMPDYFINFAAQSFVKASWDLPEMTMDVNSTGVMRCLESIIRHVPHCRFYNAGSSEQFGDVQYSPQDENHPFRARSPYGASKISAHQVVKTYRESFNLYAIQGLLFNHESPRRGEEFVTRKITKGVARIKNAINKNESFKPIELGNLDAKRDWSHAADFIEGVWIMLNQELYRSDINKTLVEVMIPQDIKPSWFKILSKDINEYVLSSNETHSIREFVELAFKKAGIQGMWFNPYPEDKTKELFVRNSQKDCILVSINPKFYRPAEVDLLLGNSTKARMELGWEPKHSFNQLVTEMVNEDLIRYE